MCTEVGIVPIMTTAGQSPGPGQRPTVGPTCCTPEDMADLIEYAWGDNTTGWGRQRARDGHPQPYALQYIELGNEQYNSEFVAQVRAMEERVASTVTVTWPLHGRYMTVTGARDGGARGVDR